MLRLKYWTGKPTNCDYCGKPLGERMFDAATRRGWACLCQSCFTKLGCSLGQGCGQEYQRQEDGRFLKVRG